MSNKATAVFDAEDSKLTAAFNRIDHHLKETQEHFNKLGEIGEGVLTLLAAEAIFEKIKEGFEGVRGALEMGEKFHIMSQNTGIAVADLVLVAQALRSVGLEGEDSGKLIAKMQKNIVSGSANETLERMGMNLEELKKASPLEQFESIGKAINAIKNPTERAAAAIAIFGKTGAGLLSLFAGEGLEKAAGHVGNQAQILGEDAALFREVAEELNLAGVKVQGFFVGVADKVAPVLKPLLDRFATMDFSHAGQQVGDAIGALDAALSDGHLGELLSANLDYAFAAADNYILGELAAVPVIIGGALMSSAADFISFLLSGLGKIAPMLRGAVSGSITSLDRYSADLKSRDLEGETLKSVQPYDLAAFDKARVEIVAKSLEAANTKRAEALKDVPTTPGQNGDLSELSDGKFVQANVSALTRVGGGFGGSGGDPLVSEAQRQTGLLQRIAAALESAKPLPAANMTPVGGYG